MLMVLTVKLFLSEGPNLPVISNLAEKKRKIDSRNIIVDEMFQNCTSGFLLPMADWLVLKYRITADDGFSFSRKKNCKEKHSNINTLFFFSLRLGLTSFLNFRADILYKEIKNTRIG